MQPLTTDHVRQVLNAFASDLSIQIFEESTATSEEAASVLGCEVGQIAKSICLLVDGAPLLVVASGDQRVDDKKVAALHGVGRKKVRMANPEACLTIFGYTPGAVPPIAHRTPKIPVLLDQSMQRYEQLFAAAGASNALFGISLGQLVTITGGTFADVVKD